MKSTAQSIIGTFSGKGVDYADVRVVQIESEEIAIKNEAPEAIKRGSDFGFGVRVLIDGAWGFSASNDFSQKSITETCHQAITIARASGRVSSRKDRFHEMTPYRDTYATLVRIDPFGVSLAEKVDTLLRCTEIMLKEPSVQIAKGFMTSFRKHQVFADTHGSLIEQEITESGGGIACYAISNGEMQVRSYPNSFRGNFATAGFEFTESLDLESHAARIAEESAALLSAPTCPQTETTLIIDSSQLALQIHESIGHPIELDRVLGYEISYAGGSFLSAEMIDQFRYGSPLVNVYADATIPGGLGTFGYDDEGVPAQRVPIIIEGILKGLLTSRSTAPEIGRKSNGTMRADGWQSYPLIRMTNINLMPGNKEYEELIAETDDGFYLETNRLWSIDDKRINFQFGTEIAWEIKNGKKGRIFKNPIYTGITPQFWRSCDGIANEKHFTMWGTPNCGKGEPSQLAHVGHGTSPARFRKVKIGGAR